MHLASFINLQTINYSCEIIMSGATTKEDVTYTQFACIGTGFSGIGLGATLKRWYGITDVQLFDAASDAGGTWNVNTYPGMREGNK